MRTKLVWLMSLALVLIFIRVTLPMVIVPSARVTPLVSIASVESQGPTEGAAPTLVFDYSWIERTELEPISDPIWSGRTAPFNNSGWDTILSASLLEAGCVTDFIYATWLTESGELDCTEALKRPGQNECRSSAGAEGPMQFMGAFYEAGISDPGWSIANLHDSARAACRMWTKMDLWSHIGNRESFALRFSSMDVFNAGRTPRYWIDRAWNVGPDGYNQALWIWDKVQSLR